MLLWLASSLSAQAQPAAQSSKPTPQEPVTKSHAPKAKASAAPAAKKQVKKSGSIAKPVQQTPSSNQVASKRDPFRPLVGKASPGSGVPENLPPGKAGLVVATTRIDGTAQSTNGMIAVVSNPQQRVYFLRQGDRVYDGEVERITLDGVVFREISKDAFGKPVERIVTKRIYATAGEQQ